MEVGEDGLSLNVLRDEMDSSVGAVLVLVKVGKRHAEDTALQVIDGKD